VTEALTTTARVSSVPADASTVRGRRPSDKQTAFKKGREAWRGEGKERFLQKLRAHGSVFAAAQHAGVARYAAYRWREDEEQFARGWNDAKEDCLAEIERSFYDRAVHGVEEPVLYQGNKVGSLRRCDTMAAIFLLKGRRPEAFRERHEHTGPGGAPIAPPAVNHLIAHDYDGNDET